MHFPRIIVSTRSLYIITWCSIIKRTLLKSVYGVLVSLTSTRRSKSALSKKGLSSCLTIVAVALLNFSMIDFFAVKVFVPVDAKGESVELIVNLN